MLVLSLHYWRLLSGSVGLVPLLLGTTISAVAGALLARTRLRFAFVGIIGLTAIYVARLAAHGSFWIQRLISSSTRIDIQFVVFDTAYLALLPVLVLSFFLFAGVERWPRLARWEPIVHGVLLLSLFWGEAHYELAAYPHISYYVGLVVVIVALELPVLFVADLVGTARVSGRARKDRRRRGAVFAILIVPLLCVVIWFLLSKYTEGSSVAGGGLLRPTLFRFDFSPFVTLESEISMSDDLVLLYRRSGAPRRDLLRRYVLGEYDERRGFYFTEETGGEVISVPDRPTYLGEIPYQLRESVRQEYFLVNLDGSTLLALNEPTIVAPYEQWDDSSFSRAYEVESQVTTATASDIARARGDLAVELAEIYTRFGDSAAIGDLALSITQESASAYESASLIERYLKENYFYSLKPGIASDGDQLSHFLFESKKGYCSYYAFSMALMVRSLGIPARVAVGFFVDPYQEVLNFYPILANMAHAWVEVYFDDLGWIEFDPTSEQLAPGEEFELGRGVDREELVSLLEEILSADLLQRADMADADVPATGLPRAGPPPVLAWMVRFWFLTLPVLYAIAMLFQKRWRSIVLAFVRQPRKRTLLRTRAMLSQLSSLGYRRNTDESMESFCARLDAIDFAAAIEMYLKALFSPTFTRDDDLCSAHHCRKAERAIASTRSLFRRVLAFFAPAVRYRPVPVEVVR